MNPSPEQVEKWRKEFVDFGWSAYLRVKTEQATEIVELKAKLAGAEAEIAALKQGLRRADEKLAEVMPLADWRVLQKEPQHENRGSESSSFRPRILMPTQIRLLIHRLEELLNDPTAKVSYREEAIGSPNQWYIAQLVWDVDKTISFSYTLTELGRIRDHRGWAKAQAQRFIAEYAKGIEWDQ
jgi:uncharacterized coiled-coil protein SlyX